MRLLLVEVLALIGASYKNLVHLLVSVLDRFVRRSVQFSYGRPPDSRYLKHSCQIGANAAMTLGFRKPKQDALEPILNQKMAEIRSCLPRVFHPPAGLTVGSLDNGLFAAAEPSRSSRRVNLVNIVNLKKRVLDLQGRRATDLLDIHPLLQIAPNHELSVPAGGRRSSYV